MLPGFLGTRSESFMLDFVVTAMVAVVPLLLLSVLLVKFRQRYAWHKTLQIVLASALLVAVTAFEVEMWLIEWEAFAEPSPYWEFPARGVLWVHLCFAVPTLVLWIWVIVQALRKFPSPPAPNTHSSAHKKTAWVATIGMVMTALTGWLFYYMAFMAESAAV